MEYIEFLGTSGTRGGREYSTCLRISKKCVIDTGNLINGVGDDLFMIEHIFLTHSHLDHTIDIPFIAELFSTKQKIPLKIYALRETLNDLRDFVFNDRMWPNFEAIELLEGDGKIVEMIEIEPDQHYTVDGVTLTPFKTNHTDGSCGYVIEKEGHGIVFTSDTYRCKKIWEIMDLNPHIHSLVVDVSFPSQYEHLAQNSKHMTPKILAEELTQCTRQNFRIFPMHLKGSFQEIIKQELTALGIFEREGHILESFECLSYSPEFELLPCNRHIGESVISQIISIGTALSAEKNIDALLEMIIIHTKQLTNADGGTLYLYNSKTKQLEFKVIQNDSLKIQMGGTAGNIEWEPLELYDAQGEKNHHMVAAMCALEDVTVNIPDVYKSTGYDFSGTIEFDKKTGYRSKSMLVLPLKDHEENLIAVLQLINKQDAQGGIISFDRNDEEMALSLGSQAAVALTKQHLINDLELLLESFLKTINVAIEEKSPYTAGHIDRMVSLSMMIARAISDDENHFKEIRYDEEKLKEIKFSALMHDIGKITTPEHIIDKSMKLETIYDRIETVKLKFEILKRDAYTRYLIKKSAHTDPEFLRTLEKEFHQSVEQLDEEYRFLADANAGSEFFSNESVARVHAIAQRKILFDGVEEPLLSDDEVDNLCVQKGTLTSAQRDIINNHAMVSLRMLNQLPFPHKLERVAEVASGHHEKINGKGYPLGLKGDELSFEARILAIADIFEALSASDRPYKKAKKLSEVMKILYFMAKDGDIDIDIVRFFYESGLYLRYAKETLKEEYIDAVNLDFTL